VRADEESCCWTSATVPPALVRAGSDAGRAGSV
jgi:hypothetical protein